jgi:hypothetical protein
MRSLRGRPKDRRGARARRACHGCARVDGLRMWEGLWAGMALLSGGGVFGLATVGSSQMRTRSFRILLPYVVSKPAEKLKRRRTSRRQTNRPDAGESAQGMRFVAVPLGKKVGPAVGNRRPRPAASRGTG